MSALTNQVALVTGASSGIGRATAISLARHGASVVLSGRYEEPLLATAEDVRREGGKAHAIVGDIRDENLVKNLVQAAIAEFGRLDMLVNCAGLAYPGPAIEGITDQWREMFDTNVLALSIACREALRVMQDSGGTIVNVSSLAGSEATPNFAMYSATKHAVNGFTDSLRLELEGTSVRVVLVEPGQTMTSFGRHIPYESLQQICEQMGVSPGAVPNFRGGHAPQPFIDEVLRQAQHLFFSAEQVADRIVETILDPSTDDHVVLRPEERPPDQMRAPAMKVVDEPKGRVVLFYSRLQHPQWPVWPPLDLYAIATALMHAGYEVALIDSRIEARERLVHELEGALFVGISVMFGNQINNMLADAEYIKSIRPDVPIVVGGWFPALFPEALFDSPLIDIAVVGPGDFNTPEIADRLREGRSMEGIEGVYAREDGKIVRNAFGHLPDIRKTHPMPYELLGIQRYIHPNGWLVMITSRGCPGQCNFCSIACLSPRRWTALRAERSVDEMEELVRLGAQAIRILDTDFCADIKRVEQICRAILERGLEFRWEILARHWNLRRMTDEQIKLMRWAGCTEIECGVETGSQRLADAIVKDTNVEEVSDTLQRFVDNGIRWKINFMFGLPTETGEDLAQTLRLLDKMSKLGERAVHFQLYRYTPVPGGDKQSDDVWEQTTFEHKPTRLSLQELADFPVIDMKPERMFWISPEHEVNVRRVHYFYAPLAYISGCFDPAYQRPAWQFVLRLMRPLARWRLRHYKLGFPFEMWLNERFGFELPHATDDSIGPHDDVLPPPNMGTHISNYEPLQPKTPKPAEFRTQTA